MGELYQAVDAHLHGHIITAPDVVGLLDEAIRDAIRRKVCPNSCQNVLKLTCPLIRLLK